MYTRARGPPIFPFGFRSAGLSLFLPLALYGLADGSRSLAKPFFLAENGPSLLFMTRTTGQPLRAPVRRALRHFTPCQPERFSKLFYGLPFAL